jgi:hypothetical protein
MSKEHGPFDPSDPYQIMCEHFRGAIIRAMDEALCIAVFEDLPIASQVSALILGSMTGIIEAGYIYASPLREPKLSQAREAVVITVKNSVDEAVSQAKTRFEAMS